MASIVFPLRTSVELFKDPESPEAITRVKEAAVLFDEVILETGLYTVTVGDSGSFPFWTPPHQVTPDMLEHSREVVEPGTPWGLTVQRQSGPGGEPVGEPHPLIGGTVDVQYAARTLKGSTYPRDTEPA